MLLADLLCSSTTYGTLSKDWAEHYWSRGMFSSLKAPENMKLTPIIRDGGRVVADCGWDDYRDNFHSSHSADRLGDASIGEWWAYFDGGGAP